LWEPDVTTLAKDESIRKLTSKTLFQRGMTAGNITCIETLAGHENCRKLKIWKQTHHIEAGDIICKSHSSRKSVYVPLSKVLSVHGNDDHVTVGIKSLETACLEDASSFGDPPNTCANQMCELKDTLKHREDAHIWKLQ